MLGMVAACEGDQESSSAVQPRCAHLPYGNTLHYVGCGCPFKWQKGGRVADVVDVFAQKYHTMFQQQHLSANRPLRIAYMLPHHNITGGMKCLVEHIRLLKTRGHCTIAVHRSDTAKTAMPPWTTVTADEDVVCNLHQRLSDVYPVNNIDVVVVGIFHQVAELLASVPAPILYWEQGHEWVFGDPVRFQVAQNYLKQDQLFHMIMHLPAAMASVSDAIQDILECEFGRSSVVIPNGIDCERFYPGPASFQLQPKYCMVGRPPSQTVASVTPKSVLIVGNPALPLKAFNTAITVLAAVNRFCPIHVTWVCQQQPTAATVPSLVNCGLDIITHVSPSQDKLPQLYRGHDVFLFTSKYEAWGMPVLEAMASGLPVVTSNCLGVKAFAKDRQNALISEPDDVAGLVRSVLLLLSNQDLAKQLGAAGRDTALTLTPECVLARLEALLYSLAACGADLLQLRHACLPDIQLACTWASEACSRPK